MSLRYNSVKLMDLNWGPLGNSFKFNSTLGNWSWTLLVGRSVAVRHEG